MTILDGLFVLVIIAVLMLWLASMSGINELETDYLTRDHAHFPSVDAWTKDDTQ